MFLTAEMGAALVGWFEKNKRTMAWRDDPSPYHVWVSEIMLQQTRVETVHSYYARFMKAFPTLQSLADAGEEVLLKQWEGLGYYSRARNIQKAAKTVVSEYGGVVPDSFEKLVKLPGIGSYTAGAILSIAFHKPFPVADGNVLRVLSRVLGRTDDVRDEKTKERFEKELKAYLDGAALDPGEFNQGLMELGALVCIPNGRPKCTECPWNALCEAKRRGLEESLPVISPKAEKKVEEKTVLLLYEGEKLLVEKRSGKDVLNGLYGFPSAEGELSQDRLSEAVSGGTVKKLPDQRHVFTHKVWNMHCYEVRVEDFGAVSGRVFGLLYGTEGTPASYRLVGKKELEEEIALPAAFRKWPLFGSET